MTAANPPKQSERSAGSPPSGEPAFIVVGRIRKPHGIRGEMILELMTEFPERLNAGCEVYIGQDYQLFHIKNCRGHYHRFIVSFDEYRTRNEVEGLRNQLVHVRTDTIPPLPDGEYYYHQIIGLRVISDNGDFLGNVSGIIETGSNDVCIVKAKSGQDLLLPVIDDVILSINTDSGEMLVHLLPGLIPDR